MTGAAVLLGRTAGIRPVYILMVLNAICLLVGSQRLGRPFVEATAVGLVTLGLIIRLVGPLPPMLPLPAAIVIGGLGVGLGTSLILRAGGALDGCEILGVLIQERLGISVVWVLAVANAGIFGTAFGMYGPRASLPSMVAQATGQLVICLLLMGNTTRRL